MRLTGMQDAAVCREGCAGTGFPEQVCAGSGFCRIQDAQVQGQDRVRRLRVSAGIGQFRFLSVYLLGYACEPAVVNGVKASFYRQRVEAILVQQGIGFALMVTSPNPCRVRRESLQFRILMRCDWDMI